MAQEQLGVCAEANIHGLYLLFNANDDREGFIRQVLAKLPGLFDELGERFSEAMLCGLVAIGTSYWDVLYPNGRPALLKPFPAIQSEGYSMPGIPYDILIQIRSDRADVNHLMGLQVIAMFANAVELVEQIKGFRYLDGRDLTGFVDGTKNPVGVKKRQIALVDKEDPDFSGGSYIHIQRYQHNLRRWEHLDVLDQEKVIGRTKIKNQEFAESKKPLDCHIKRAAVIDEEGQPLQILRQSMPYGHMKAQGLFFISCCKTPENFEKILTSMVKGDGHGNTDSLLNFTQAQSGAAFFAPSRTFLMKNGS
ncbi:MAG: putative iron-dependent peroxidase [Alteromonadaceae bacterium]|jgi:putative iron-dependent peroxidase